MIGVVNIDGNSKPDLDNLPSKLLTSILMYLYYPIPPGHVEAVVVVLVVGVVVLVVVVEAVIVVVAVALAVAVVVVVVVIVNATRCPPRPIGGPALRDRQQEVKRRRGKEVQR